MQPVETLIGGARGRLLEALARVDAELPVSRLAAVAGVGRTRASSLLEELAQLGVVQRHRVGPTTLVRLDRENAAGRLVASLSGLRAYVISELQHAARELQPEPTSVILFGSLARGSAGAASDVDILAVRPTVRDSEQWQASLGDFERRVRRLTGNRVHVLDYDPEDLRRRYSTRDDDPGAGFWRSVSEDAIVLTGASLLEIVGEPVSRADAAAYLAKANSWLGSARESLVVGRWDVAAGSAVTAGVNACDALCGALLGERAGGGHAEAVALLITLGTDGKQASRQLAQLLRFKTPAQYDPLPMAEPDARRAVDLADRLVQRAATVLARH